LERKREKETHRALEARPSGEIAVNVYDRSIADYGLCRSELLL
jgi:hypothetical protein